MELGALRWLSNDSCCQVCKPELSPRDAQSRGEPTPNTQHVRLHAHIFFFFYFSIKTGIVLLQYTVFCWLSLWFWSSNQFPSCRHQTCACLSQNTLMWYGSWEHGVISLFAPCKCPSCAYPSTPGRLSAGVICRICPPPLPEATDPWLLCVSPTAPTLLLGHLNGPHGLTACRLLRGGKGCHFLRDRTIENLVRKLTWGFEEEAPVE